MKKIMLTMGLVLSVCLAMTGCNSADRKEIEKVSPYDVLYSESEKFASDTLKMVDEMYTYAEEHMDEYGYDDVDEFWNAVFYESFTSENG